ncbi:ataxin-10, partial [Tremellales sp. Uapishka_1]
MDYDNLLRALRQDPRTVIQSTDKCGVLTEAAEKAARYIAQHLDERRELIEDLPAIWAQLNGFWRSISSHYGLAAGSASETFILALALALGKLERNLLAGEQHYQLEALGMKTASSSRYQPSESRAASMSDEQLVRKILFAITNFERIQDEQYFPVHTVLTQLLSNMISPVDDSGPANDLADSILELYTSGDRNMDVIIPDEPITPSQTILLKLLDSHLSTKPSSSPTANQFLLPLFHTLSTYTILSVRQAADDARLPKMLEGLVLVLEILSSIGLEHQRRIDASEPIEPSRSEMVLTMKQEFIKPLVELLAALNAFLPRIKPLQPSTEDSQTLRFQNIKRDLVQLLSILTYQDKAVCDEVRKHGGVEIILGLCEVDDRNPYLREQALFTVRNLMHNNPENQEIITKMQPLGVVGENGELLPLPESMKKKQQP